MIERMGRIARIFRRIAELSITHHLFRSVGRPPVMLTHDVPHGLTTQPISSLCDEKTASTGTLVAGICKKSRA
jgi:hypothetical protein